MKRESNKFQNSSEYLHRVMKFDTVLYRPSNDGKFTDLQRQLYDPVIEMIQQVIPGYRPKICYDFFATNTPHEFSALDPFVANTENFILAGILLYN